MKRILMITALLAFTFNVNAQDDETTGGFSQGDATITGSFNFGSTTVAESKTNSITFNPSVGYFVSDNIAVGVGLGISSAKEEFLGTVGLKTNTLFVGAFGQYYFTPENQFSFLGQLTAGYSTSKAEQATIETKLNGFTVGLAPGVSYFITNNFALQANVGILSYQSFKPDVDNAESTNTINLGVNFSDINFGLVYKF